jgi:hypothetical protein
MKKFILILLFCINSCLAAEISFTWNKNPEPGVKYKLYYSAVGAATNNFVVVGTNNVTLTNLPKGQYKFYLVAVSTNNVESNPSTLILKNL